MDTLFTSLFSLGIPFYEKIIRTLAVYVVLIVLLRLFGKRELGQINPFDLVVLLTLSNAVQNAIIGDDTSLLGGIIGAATLLGVNSLVVHFFYHHERAARLLEGETVVLINQGRIVPESMEQERISEAELLAACHKQGVERIGDVERAVLETTGTISVFAYHPTRDEATDADIVRRLERIEALLQGRSTEGASMAARSDTT